MKMKRLKSLLFVSLACWLGNMSAQTLAPEGTWIKPSDENIQYVGRVDFQQPDSPTFTYPGVQINARFEGTSLRLKTKPMSGYFMVQIDGCTPYKVSFNAPKDSIVTLATALRNESHEVRIVYINEGYERMPEFRGFGLDEGCKLFYPFFQKTERLYS